VVWMDLSLQKPFPDPCMSPAFRCQWPWSLSPSLLTAFSYLPLRPGVGEVAWMTVPAGIHLLCLLSPPPKADRIPVWRVWHLLFSSRSTRVLSILTLWFQAGNKETSVSDPVKAFHEDLVSCVMPLLMHYAKLQELQRENVSQFSWKWAKEVSESSLECLCVC